VETDHVTSGITAASQRAQSGFGPPLRAPELARARPSPRGAPSGCCWLLVPGGGCLCYQIQPFAFFR
jgi:hypothetical protein